ncbi:MAG: ROK family protein [Thermoplasmata archaeon]
MTYLCIDIGATKTLIGVGERDFEFCTRIKTDKFLKEPMLEARFMEGVEKAVVATPGPLDRENGIIYPPNIPGKKIDMMELLSPNLDTFFLVNDCIAGVVGEYFFGEISASNMVYITISSGIGAGVIVGNSLIEGWRGNFAEVGHLKVGGNRRCGCGGRGHWEAYCSGNNLPGFAYELTGKKFKDAEELFIKYHEGNSAAKEVVQKMGEYNAIGISNVVNAYNPELIVLGGGVAVNHPEVITSGLEPMLERDVISELPEIAVTALEDRSVLYGLLALCHLDENMDILESQHSSIRPLK